MYEHIRCNFLPSRYLLAWLVLLNLWVIALLCIVKWPGHDHVIWFFRVIILLGVAWHTYYIVRRDYWFEHADSVVACFYHQGEWQLVMGNGQTIDVELHGDTVVWYELMVLGFTCKHHRRTRFRVIFSDSLEKDIQRKLRVILRLQVAKHNANGVVEKIKSLILALKIQS